MELALDLKKRYTYADYLTWIDGKVRELYDGFVKMMSPAPKAFHQEKVTDLVREISMLVRKHNGGCKVYPAPFDVRLPKNGETDDDKIYTVVQPDVCVVCDLSKIDDKGCLGAPDLVVEILSMSSVKYDMDEKFHLYERAGVREYWVVLPYYHDRGIIQFILQDDGKYDEGTRYETGAIPIHIFGGATIELDNIFTT